MYKEALLENLRKCVEHSKTNAISANPHNQYYALDCDKKACKQKPARGIYEQQSMTATFPCLEV